jgi:hypothetical protein
VILVRCLLPGDIEKDCWFGTGPLKGDKFSLGGDSYVVVERILYESCSQPYDMMVRLVDCDDVEGQGIEVDCVFWGKNAHPPTSIRFDIIPNAGDLLDLGDLGLYEVERRVLVKHRAMKSPKLYLRKDGD